MQNQGKIRCILLRQAKDKRQKTKDERQQTGFLGDGANDEMIFVKSYPLIPRIYD